MHASLHDQDAALLADLLGPLSPSGTPWSFFKRHGRVLIACRRDHHSLSSALKLYQPQRPAARLGRRALATAAPWGAVKFLPTARFSASPDHPVTRIEQDFSVQIPAILLGNPIQPERRSILLAIPPGKPPLVFKLGTHPEAISAIRREADFLARWGGKTRGIPALKAQTSGPGWLTFAIPFLDGSGVDPDNLETITGLLGDWLLPESPVPATEFPALRALDPASLPPPGTRLIPSITHGDLAPWNLIQSKDENLTAIDWENGEPSGIPGWDLVHCLFQTGHLVKRLPPADLIHSIHLALKHPAAARYLARAGWQDQSRCLIASYLAHRIAAGETALREMLAHA